MTIKPPRHVKPPADYPGRPAWLKSGPFADPKARTLMVRMWRANKGFDGDDESLTTSLQDRA